LPELPTLPEGVAERWTDIWGGEVVEAARRAIAAPPPLDLTLRETKSDWAERLGGISLAPGHVRLAPGARVTICLDLLKAPGGFRICPLRCPRE